MALSKNILTNYGVETTYHVINGIYDYPKNDIPLAHIDVQSYVSEAARMNGGVPVETSQYSFEGDNYPFTSDGAVRADAYDALKTLPEFVCAEDV